MEEPTVWETLRSIQSVLTRMEQAQALYVTQEQREADKAIHDLTIASLVKDQEEDRSRITALEDDKAHLRRIVLSAFLLPILVLVGAWALGVKP